MAGISALARIQREVRPAAINFALFLVTLTLTLSVPVEPFKLTFPDSADYLRQAGISIVSPEFFAPRPAPGFYPRPFVVPLCYKLMGSNPGMIVVMQKIVHAVAAFLLAASLLLLLRHDAAKYLLLAGVYLLVSWWTIVGWTTVLLSESLSFSFLFCWISSVVLFCCRRNRTSFVLQLVSICLLALTRDTWPYVLIFFYLTLLGSSILFDRSLIRPTLICFGVSVLLFASQNWTAQIGERKRLPLLNNIVLRILPNENQLRWFVRRGLPQAPALSERFKKDATSESKTNNLFELYSDNSYSDLFAWINSHGPTVYMQFLLSRPRTLFLLRESRQDLSRVLSHDFSLYLGLPRGYSRLSQDIFPMFHSGGILTLLIALLVIFYRQRQEVLLVPLLFAVTTIFYAVLSYQADAMEVERHLVLTRPMMDLIGILGIALLVDRIAPRSPRPGVKLAP